jgi:hypothetical protein
MHHLLSKKLSNLSFSLYQPKFPNAQDVKEWTQTQVVGIWVRGAILQFWKLRKARERKIDRDEDE